MQPHEIKQLIARYLDGTCTPSEKAWVEDWYNKQCEEHSTVSEPTPAEVEDSSMRMREALMAGTYPARSINYRWWMSSAAVLLIAWMGISYFNAQKTDSVADVMPGGRRATLRIATGQVIDLSAAQTGIIVGDQLSYLDGTKVLAETEFGQPASPTSEDPMVLLELSTPRGGTYHAVLSDGTGVWLNAGSSITYPNRFADDVREVSIVGEAYLEVAKSTVPFRVHSRGQTVDVLGTTFNISAYPDEPAVRTTLVAGSVAVKNSVSGQVTPLLPGEQSIVSEHGSQIEKVDVSPFVGWQKGEFVFMDTELREVMKQLARWYDVEVVYEGMVPQTPFYGKISRNLSLSNLLTVFNEAGVNFSIQKHRQLNQLVVKSQH